MDVYDLAPGQQWNDAITKALQQCVGFLFFLSPRSLRSEWVQRELDVATTASDPLIVPVLLHEPEELDFPDWLTTRQWLPFAGPQSPADTASAAASIADATERYLARTPSSRTPVTTEEAPMIAAALAQDVRSSEPAGAHGTPHAVFVVHGHDAQALAQVEDYLLSVGVQPVILARQDASPQSLFQKFMTVGAQARFAIVLLGPDDWGASRRQYDAPGVGDRALQFRARQNVVLELGFFYGRLGWESVFVVYRTPDEVFPNFERPSDLDGVVFDSISDADWRTRLGERLTAAGFELSRLTGD
jgi:predicted nucleotide-binding protein